MIISVYSIRYAAAAPASFVGWQPKRHLKLAAVTGNKKKEIAYRVIF